MLIFNGKKQVFNEPLGVILERAGLVSSEQIELALQLQKISTHLRIGEILTLRGLLKRQTVEFFAQELPIILKENRNQPLGKYLKQAGLLNEAQIKEIIYQQKQGQTWVRFGALAVFLGYVEQPTVNFFIEYLSISSKSDSSLIGFQVKDKNSLKDKRIIKTKGELWN